MTQTLNKTLLTMDNNLRTIVPGAGDGPAPRPVGIAILGPPDADGWRDVRPQHRPGVRQRKFGRVHVERGLMEFLDQAGVRYLWDLTVLPR